MSFDGVFKQGNGAFNPEVADSEMRRAGVDIQAFFGGALHANNPLVGDFYREPDDVVRSAFLPVAPLDMSLGWSIDSETAGGKAKHLQCQGSSSDCHLHLRDTGEQPKCTTKCFQDGDMPPELSPEIAAYLEKTTVHLSTGEPVMLANEVLRFLQTAIGGQVDKVSRLKFSVRAQAYMAGHWCSIKIRVYRNQGGHTWEIQKRSGDPLAFASLYRQVKNQLENPGLQPSENYNAPQPKMLGLSCPPCSIQPLLDIAHYHTDINMLAEAASGLAVLAQDAEVAAELRKPTGVAVMEKLKGFDDFKVAYPTSQLFNCVYGQ